MNRKERREQQARLKRVAPAGAPSTLQEIFAVAAEQFQRGHYAAAEEGFRRASELAPQSAAVAYNLGQVLHLRGARDESVVHYRRALALKPDQAEIWFNLGNVLREQGNAAEAIDAYRRVVGLKPSWAEALNNLGNLLVSQGKLQEALPVYTQAAHFSPADADLQHRLGVLLNLAGNADSAEQAFRRAIEINQGHAEAWGDLGRIMLLQQRHVEAVDAYRRFMTMRPDDIEAQNNLGVALDRLGRWSEAEAAFRIALSLRSDYAEAYSNLGNCLASQERMVEAETAYHKAIELNPNFAAAHNNLGLALAAKGQLEDAEAAYRQALAVDACFTEAYRNIVTGKKIKSLENDDVQRMQRLLAEGSLNDVQTMHLCFALGKAYDDCNLYDKAFACYEKANQIKRRFTLFDINHFRSHVDRIIDLFDAEFFARNVIRGSNDETPVFIVGMPRSGTTLIEQIVASHPRVFGAGELIKIGDLIHQLENPPGRAPRNYPEFVSEWSADEVRSTASEYVHRLTRDVTSPDILRVTDKMPFNFIHLGLIALLFPNAKIIHCRRHPLDTCLSNFFQYFPKGADYAYRLEETGLYFKEYERLMRHWQQVLPIQLLDIDYETVISDVEIEARRLIDYLQLPWDEACLQFYKLERSVRTLSIWQVRQPIYTQSKQRWRNYRPHLEPLIKIIGSDST
ncbi:MAG: tetratricopeptide repeat protein [Gammaproteobacteria bacterium]|nr:tetratricopeptide repeat protein [Gammaproteobacteria bacterium]